MPDVEELKSRARRAEAAGDYRMALEAYRRALERERESAPDRMDPALRLRIGDLHARLGEPDRALEAYLRASELYARRGLVPNAIAVCNKVLGRFPEHLECHRLLAELQLEIGLTADARASVLRYLEQAPTRGRTAAAREAARAFLEAEPDQEVAVALAELLAEEGRTEEALEVLRRVWEERTGLRRPAGRIEAFARELDPGADLSAWTPVWPPRGREGTEGRPASPVAAAEAAGTPEPGGLPEPGGRPEPAGTSAAGGSPEAGERTATPAAVEAPREGGGDGKPPLPGEEEASPASRVSPAASRSSSLPRNNGVGTTEGPGTPEGMGTPAAPRVTPPSPRPAPGDRGAREPDREAELRRGLELVEEMLEVAPGHMDLHRRRVRYARRLGDLRRLEQALLGLAHALAERGSHRGARFLFEEVLEQFNPGSAAAREGLRGLDRREAMPPVGGPGDEEAPRAEGAAEGGGGVDRRFRRRLRQALSASSRELAWLHAAAGSCDPTGAGPVPGASHELLGRYLLMRGRPSEAAEHLEAALDRLPAAGDRTAGLLYHLGRARRRAGQSDRARSCFERLAAADPDFRAAWAVVTPEDA